MFYTDRTKGAILAPYTVKNIALYQVDLYRVYVVQLQMEPLWLQTHKPKGAVEGVEGAICLNGSPGSPKSSLSFVCVGACIIYFLCTFQE